MVSSEKIAHAFLFSGPRGTGKTSAARLLAKVVNCHKRAKNNPEPCDRCEACVSIREGRAVDVLEIDAASNRGIDDIRELREKVKLAPAQLKNKIYIIDEVHMLTTEAFNALLKTLEEPPASTIFILATTDPERLPATIISRCVRFNFRKARNAETVSSLKRVVKGEKIKVEEGVLEAIAKAAEGSFRDAHKVLDQLGAGLGEKEITLRETLTFLGLSEEFSPQKMLALLVQNNLTGSLLEVDRLTEGGADLVFYVRGLLDRLRRSLLAKVGVDAADSPAELASLDVDDIRRLLAIFASVSRELKFHPIPQLPLELAAVEWCGGKTQNPRAETDDVGGEKKNKTPAGVGLKKSPAGQKTENAPAPAKRVLPANGDGVRLVVEKWRELLTQIRPKNHSIEALLRATRPIDFHEGSLTLEVFYRFHKERLEEAKIRNIFEEVASEVLATPVRLKCVLGQKTPGPEVVDGADAVETVMISNEKEADRLDEEEDDDIIKVAEGIFGN